MALFLEIIKENIKYTILYLLVTYTLLATIGYAATNQLAETIGEVIGFFIFFYAFYIMINKKTKCPECGKKTKFVRKEFSKELSKKTYTNKIIKMISRNSNQQIFDINKGYVYKCKKCSYEYIKKTKSFVLATNKPEKYISIKDY